SADGSVRKSRAWTFEALHVRIQGEDRFPHGGGTSVRFCFSADPSRRWTVFLFFITGLARHIHVQSTGWGGGWNASHIDSLDDRPDPGYDIGGPCGVGGRPSRPGGERPVGGPVGRRLGAVVV